ncbi:MAG TPA: methyltransferase domain-containing protein [Polyangiaceae bacterium]|nr:methyltransferase domain-containing protein [Polyangiaceae bacterium]
MSHAAVDVPDVSTAEGAIDRWMSADPHLASLLAAGLPRPHAVARWGLHLLKEGRSLDAVTAFRVAVALAPDSASSWTNLGMAFDRAGMLDPASACFEQSVALSKAQPDTWLLLGLSRKKRGELALAQTAYEVALEQDPKSAVVWQCLGLVKEELRDYAGAADSFEACVKLSAPSAPVFANLGKLSYQIGRIQKAHEAFMAASKLDPGNLHYAGMLRKTRFLADALAGVPVDEALARFGDTVVMAASESGEGPPDASAEATIPQWLEIASGLLGSFGYMDPAVALARKRLELQPNSATGKYHLAALLADPRFDRSPAEYIVESFDAFAKSFDAKLVGVLGYDVPEKLCAVVRSVMREGDEGGAGDVLDIGCGTGLCGPLLRPLARTLAGVDLSSKMLELAAARGVYDALAREDIVAYLGRAAARFGLVVAADVLIYFGDLSAVFAETAKALRSGGLFAFSTELHAGEGYRLQTSGRFAHSPDYVKRIAAPWFEEVAVVRTTIRLEGNERTPGHLFLVRRRAG